MTKKNKKLVMIGAGGHAKVCYDIAQLMNKWDEIIILDDNPENDYFEIEGSITEVEKFINDSEFFVAIGENKTRKNITEKIASKGAEIIALIHPHSVIASNVEINEGTVIMAGVVINSSSNIGKGCIINTSSCIDHDNSLEDYVHLSPGVRTGGTVKISANSWIGIGSMLINNISIYKDSIIGAGSVVHKSISQSGTYVGVPARRIK